MNTDIVCVCVSASLDYKIPNESTITIQLYKNIATIQCSHFLITVQIKIIISIQIKFKEYKKNSKYKNLRT